MTVDSEAGHGTGWAGTVDPRPVSRITIFWYALLGSLLAGWLLFGWLVLEQGFINSAGESFGAGFALLLVVSVIGAVRRHRRRRT